MSAAVTFLALGVVACGPSGEQTTVVVARGVDAVAGPAECAAPIEAFIATIDKDAAAGRLAEETRTRIVGDLRTIRGTCASGSEVDANRQLAVVKQRYGYR